VHVRKPADAVEVTLRNVAAALGARFYVDVASPGSSWIPVFPDHAGQDFAVSAMIAERVGTFVIHVLLHDGDVFAYTVYHGTRTIDEFSSDPAYFAAATPSERSRLHGQPTRFAELIAPGHSVAEVETTLERVRRRGEKTTGFLREGERLEDLLERADRELDELKNRSAGALAQRDARFQERAAALLGERLRDVPVLVERLVRLETPAARTLLDEYAAELQTIIRTFSAPDSIQARLEQLGPAEAEEAMRELADALALPNALSSYEELAERAALGDRDANLRHVPPQRSSETTIR
jgi:hypothetical protein